MTERLASHRAFNGVVIFPINNALEGAVMQKRSPSPKAVSCKKKKKKKRKCICYCGLHIKNKNVVQVLQLCFIYVYIGLKTWVIINDCPNIETA